MRAQNEPLPTVVRLVRGEAPGEPDPDVPGAFHVPRVDETALAEGRIWPQSAASQLAGLAVGARDGERTLDLCAAPGGKATMLAGEVVAVEVHPGRARELRENVARLGATNGSRSWRRTGWRCRRSSTASTARSSTPRAPGSACSPAAPTCAGAPSRCPSSSSRSSARRRRASGPAARSSTRSARSTPTRTRRSSTRPASRSTRASPRSGRSSATRRGPEFLLTLPHRHRTSGFFVARLRVA